MEKTLVVACLYTYIILPIYMAIDLWKTFVVEWTTTNVFPIQSFALCGMLTAFLNTPWPHASFMINMQLAMY